jgi:predicted metal-dependent peptidase
MAELKGKMKQALNDLTVLHPFWACLAIHMPFEEKTDIPTFATDGKKIYYNLKFSESLSRAVNMFALAHEPAHPMFHHLSRIFVRRPGRSEVYGFRDGKPMYFDPILYNIAGDHVINLMLKDCGFEIWKDCYCDPQFKGMTTEQVYDKLEDKQKKTGKKLGLDKITGGDIMAPGEGFSEDEVREIVTKAAAIARSQGKLPASLEALIKEATEPQYPVYSLLERFIDSNIRDEDHTFAIPNKRYLPYGIVMPAQFCDKISDVTIVYDTSGSVPDEDLQRFHRVAGDILRKLSPKVVRLIQCDADVHKVDEFTNLSQWASGVKLTGRGGTSFVPPFEWLRKKQIAPSCLVYLTDMEGDFPRHAPNYPVMWVSTQKEHVAPFGMTVHLNQ